MAVHLYPQALQVVFGCAMGSTLDDDDDDVKEINAAAGKATRFRWPSVEKVERGLVLILGDELKNEIRI